MSVSLDDIKRKIEELEGVGSKDSDNNGIGANTPIPKNDYSDDDYIDLDDDSSDEIKFDDKEYESILDELGDKLGLNEGDNSSDEIQFSDTEYESILNDLGDTLGLKEDTNLGSDIGENSNNFNNPVKSNKPPDANKSRPKKINEVELFGGEANKIEELDIARNKMLLEKERLHKEKENIYRSEVDNYSDKADKVELTPEQYVRGQKLLFGDNDNSEEFTLEDYVTAVAIHDSNGKKPDFIPNPKDKHLQVASFNLINSMKTKLTPSNSIDCSGFSKMGIFKKELPRFIYSSDYGVRQFKKKSFSYILELANKALKEPITSVTFMNGTLVVNDRIINTNGINHSISNISTIVNYNVLKKYAPKLNKLNLDEEAGECYCNQYKLNSDILDIANDAFNRFKLLDILVYDGFKLTRTNYETAIRKDKLAAEINKKLEINEKRNEFDALLKGKVTRPDEISNEELLKASNRSNKAGWAERRLYGRNSTARNIIGFGVGIGAFMFLGLGSILDGITFGRISRGITKLQNAGGKVVGEVSSSYKKARKLNRAIRGADK